MQSAPAIQKLLDELERLPGVGPKSAQRMAYWILNSDRATALRLAQAIVEVKDTVHFCSRCFNYAEDDLCEICRSTSRNQQLLCVVSEPRDIPPIERTAVFQGVYHVLGGALSPMDGIGPDDLRIPQLMQRLGSEDIREVVLATNPNVEGETTAAYLARLIKPLGIKVTRLASGLPVGGGCELSMACDIRLASEKARFGQPEVGLGITPGFGGTQRLPRIVGVSKAMELILTAKTIKADEAKAIGLVSEVYPAEELMDKAMELANAICANAQIAVCESKRCIRMGMQTDIHTGSAFEAEAFGVTCGTEDKNEGMGAFLEKRAEKHFQNR